MNEFIKVILILLATVLGLTFIGLAFMYIGVYFDPMWLGNFDIVTEPWYQIGFFGMLLGFAFMICFACFGIVCME